MIVIGTEHGTVHFLDIDETGNVNIIANYYLTSTKITYLKLIAMSTSLIAIDNEMCFFLIRRERNNDNDIKKFLNFNRIYCDYSIVEINDMIHVMMLHVKTVHSEIITADSSLCLCDYSIIDTNDSNYSHQTQIIPLNSLYNALQFQYYDTFKLVLAAKQTVIDLIEVTRHENGKIEFNVLQTTSTIHQLAEIQLTVSAASVLTYGRDGQILLWDKTSMRMVKSVFAHDKCSGGVKDAVLESMMQR